MSTATPIDVLNRVIALDENQSVPLHAQINRALRSLIENHFEDGQKFFTEPELIDRLRVSRGTIRRALSDLSRDGLLDRHAAKGSFVRKRRRTQLTPTVGVFMPEWDSAYFSKMLAAISSACRGREMRMQVYHTHRDEDPANAYKQLEHRPQDERIILLGNEPRIANELYTVLTERGYRTVNIGSLIPDYRGAYVGVDNYQVVEHSIDYLTSLGHRRIVYMANEPATSGNVIERIAAFESITRDRGLSDSFVAHCHTQFWEDSYEKSYLKMADVWANSPRPTAVFTHSDPGAWGVIRWLRDQGVNVPQEISVMGFSDDPPSRFTYPKLSTMGQPFEEMANRALELMWTDVPQGGVRSEVFAPSLIVRESTGPSPVV